MSDVLRFDFATGPISRVSLTPVGGWRIDARLTRVGVLAYKYADGSTKREYRPAEEVFHEDSLASARGAAVTMGHPPDLVTPTTFAELSKGHVGDDVRPDGSLVAASVHVNAAEALFGVAEGDSVELSMGYICKLDETPGVTPEGEPYDAIQRTIRYNHVALLPPGAGRAGRDCRLRLDSASAIRESMSKIRIDGDEYDVTHLTSAQSAVSRLEKKVTDCVDAVKAAEGRVLAEKKRADEAEKASSPEAIRKAASFRAGLIAQARATKLGSTYLADEAEAAATDDDSIIKAVVEQLAPGMPLEGLDHAGLMIALRMASAMSAKAAPAEKEEAGSDPIKAAGTPGAALDAAAATRGTGAPKDPEPAPDGHAAHARAYAKRADSWKLSLETRKAG